MINPPQPTKHLPSIKHLPCSTTITDVVLNRLFTSPAAKPSEMVVSLHASNTYLLTNHMCMYACMHVCKYVCMHVCVCVRVCLSLSIDIYVYIHAYTHMLCRHRTRISASFPDGGDVLRVGHAAHHDGVAVGPHLGLGFRVWGLGFRV